MLKRIQFLAAALPYIISSLWSAVYCCWWLPGSSTHALNLVWDRFTCCCSQSAKYLQFTSCKALKSYRINRTATAILWVGWLPSTTLSYCGCWAFLLTGAGWSPGFWTCRTQGPHCDDAGFIWGQPPFTPQRGTKLISFKQTQPKADQDVSVIWLGAEKESGSAINSLSVHLKGGSNAVMLFFIFISQDQRGCGVFPPAQIHSSETLQSRRCPRCQFRKRGRWNKKNRTNIMDEKRDVARARP